MQSQANAADAERPLRRVIEASSDEANEKALHDIASAFFYRASSSGLAEEIADLQKQLRSLRGELAQQVSDAAEASAKAVGDTAADLADKVDTSALDDMRNRLTKRAGTVAQASTAYLKDVADKVDVDAVDDMRERLEDTVTDAAETSAAFMRSAASDVAEKVDPPSLEDIRQIVAEQIARIDLDDLREKAPNSPTRFMMSTCPTRASWQTSQPSKRQSNMAAQPLPR